MTFRKPTNRKPTTTERGLGAAHQKQVARLKAKHKPGTPCRLCGFPMWDVSTLDGGHRAGQERAAGGNHLPDALEHRRCNRSAGAKYGNALQGKIVTPGPPVPIYRAPRW